MTLGAARRHRDITAAELGRRLASADRFLILDVREPAEVSLAHIQDPRAAVVPLSRLAVQGIAALPEEYRQHDVDLVVLCHHGNRSAHVANWLTAQGWLNVSNVLGGIDAYARTVDPHVGLY